MQHFPCFKGVNSHIFPNLFSTAGHFTLFRLHYSLQSIQPELGHFPPNVHEISKKLWGKWELEVG